ncbi:bacteriocin maturation protein [Metabacillus sp. KIGAM252]|uniref:Bacteriocin maturation protein n=1 Tax=Metabacillus flavus TaxID=2823519 RepID=A0ABS5LAY7_9BACI|nr:bacteriocin maturation protein [Metabacillus flavus]MBS2967884.1 bacteriocin maturation protein [Metabacillus flavus]
MHNLDPSMRLKVNRDTVFIPDPSGEVYFRNNRSSFQMEGSTISQWIEKLMPMFTGDRSLDELTAGLTPAYRDRVYEIAGVLYNNGYLRDVSEERPHQLPEQVLRHFGSQIEFLDGFGGSGAAKFEDFRKTKVLAAGSGPFFVSLVSALLDSGLPKFHMRMTDMAPSDRERIRELVEEARKYDQEAAVEEIPSQSWQEAVQPYQTILYISEDREELTALRQICESEGKILIPAIFLENEGIAGPVLHPEMNGDVESVIKSVHTVSDERLNPPSPTAAAMLANLIAFEWLKEATGLKAAEDRQFYLLNLETLEGSWHSVTPHLKKKASVTPAVHIRERIEREPDQKLGYWLISFSELTSPQTGIFHAWEEGELTQLSLAQCRVQAVHPETGEILPEIVCAGINHEEARRESGLAGIEAYASCLMEADGIGAGETAAEAICRALHKALERELGKREKENAPIYPVQLHAEDEECRYYWQVLNTLQGPPVIGIGKEIAGFPSVWVGTGKGWTNRTGLNLTLAVRSALKQAIQQVQSSNVTHSANSPVLLENAIRLMIPAYELEEKALYSYAEDVLDREGIQLEITELEVDPLIKQGIAGVFGVALRKGESD